MVAHALYYKQAAPYLGVVEALAGLPFNIDWLGFDDIRDGVPEGIGVLVNTGSAGTAFSGAQEWSDVTVQAAVRTFVARGGGFIGVGDPTYWPGDGACFRLSDVLGVDREIGWSLSTDRYPNVVDSHFITDGLALDVGPVAPEIVPVCDDTEVLELHDGSIHAAVHTLGKGRAVYLAGLPYTVDNSRLLHRAIWWVAGRDDEFADQFIADDPRVETACYDEAGLLLVTNLSFDEVTTTISGLDDEVTLAPAGSAWIDISA